MRPLLKLNISQTKLLTSQSHSTVNVGLGYVYYAVDGTGVINIFTKSCRQKQINKWYFTLTHQKLAALVIRTLVPSFIHTKLYVCILLIMPYFTMALWIIQWEHYTSIASHNDEFAPILSQSNDTTATSRTYS